MQRLMAERKANIYTFKSAAKKHRGLNCKISEICKLAVEKEQAIGLNIKKESG